MLQSGTKRGLFPVALFVTRIESTIQGGITHQYAVSADGQRFLMNTFTQQAGSPITLILNRHVQ